MTFICQKNNSEVNYQKDCVPCRFYNSCEIREAYSGQMVVGYLGVVAILVASFIIGMYLIY